MASTTGYGTGLHSVPSTASAAEATAAERTARPAYVAPVVASAIGATVGRRGHVGDRRHADAAHEPRRRAPRHRGARAGGTAPACGPPVRRWKDGPREHPVRRPPACPLRGAVDLAAVAAAREAQAAAEQRLASGARAAAVRRRRRRHRGRLPDRGPRPVLPGAGRHRPRLRRGAQPCAVLLARCWRSSPLERRRRVGARHGRRRRRARASRQAFGVQAIPSVFAVIKGQPMELFQGALPEPPAARAARRAAARRRGQRRHRSGRRRRRPPTPRRAEPEPVGDPRFDAAYDAIEAGDWDAAEAAYQAVLNQTPADPDAKAGPRAGRAAAAHRGRRPRVRARRRRGRAGLARGAGARGRHRAAHRPRRRGVRAARRPRRAAPAATSGSRPRDHLLGLFTLVGDADPRVGKARTALANALF